VCESSTSRFDLRTSFSLSWRSGQTSWLNGSQVPRALSVGLALHRSAESSTLCCLFCLRSGEGLGIKKDDGGDLMSSDLMRRTDGVQRSSAGCAEGPHVPRSHSSDFRWSHSRQSAEYGLDSRRWSKFHQAGGVDWLKQPGHRKRLNGWQVLNCRFRKGLLPSNISRVS
jgi:hypothetical protein